MIKGIIFDMDGVLTQSAKIHSQSFEKVLQENGINNDFLYSKFAGMQTSQVFRKFLTEIEYSWTEEEIISLARKKSELAHELMKHTEYITNGATELLRELKQNYLLSIASSGSTNSVKLFIQKYHLDNYFKVVLSSKDVMNAKPDPEIFLKAVAQLGLKRSECIVVEDAVSGIMAAQEAQIQVIAIEGTTPIEQIQKLEPMAIIKSLEEIKKYI